MANEYTERFCIACRHCVVVQTNVYGCSRATKFDMVTGDRKYKNCATERDKPYIYGARNADICGIEGRYFEPKL